jgi:hypothetical protein
MSGEASNFRCKIEAHSVNPVGDEVVTFDLCYERFIHAEFLTHASFNRNASSSRAIPFSRMRNWIERDPAMPLHYGSSQFGMQSGREICEVGKAQSEIGSMLNNSIENCEQLVKYGLHKEVVNRYLEPWAWINVVASMGRPALMNFFALRMSPHAHPNMQRLAVAMARAYRASVPKRLESGEWHLPFTVDLGPEHSHVQRVVWSVARSAWCSYKTVEGRVAMMADASRRHEACVRDKHMTPCGHQFRARSDHGRNGGPVAGFDQYRHMIAGESVADFDFAALLDTTYADRDFVVPGVE